MQPKLARHPRHSRKHATHANTPLTPPTLASHPRKHATRATHASTYSTSFLKVTWKCPNKGFCELGIFKYSDWILSFAEAYLELPHASEAERFTRIINGQRPIWHSILRSLFYGLLKVNLCIQPEYRQEKNTFIFEIETKDSLNISWQSNFKVLEK